MRIRIHQLVVSLDCTPEDVVAAVARRLRRAARHVSNVEVVRRSVDARKRRGEPMFVLSVEADVKGRAPRPIQGKLEYVQAPTESKRMSAPGLMISAGSRGRVVVVGAGPAGLMAALTLAEAGAQPLLLERGQGVGDRTRQVGRFWHEGLLDPESNALYGEGGAGLFSDGKLTSRSKDRPRVRRMLEALVRFGAPSDILVDAEPHVGSDVLTKIVPALRGAIVAAGGEVRFGARVDGLEVEAGQVRALHLADERIECLACVLATGHSARDTYRALYTAGASLESKAFAVGLRAELPQVVVDRAQWGQWVGHPRLGAASFRLTRPDDEASRACYSFCMCPGGVVISCASQPGMLTTNGMSLSARDGRWGNAAFLVPAGPGDYPSEDGLPPELAGLAFQAGIERRAFEAGGGDYSLPASRLTDFLAGTSGGELPPDRSCLRSRPADLRGLLPPFVVQTLERAIPDMFARMEGTSPEQVTLYGAETRTSSPVRILRGPTGESVSVAGLFPAGEGSGYAGGIVSSGVDGMKAAKSLLSGLT